MATCICSAHSMTFWVPSGNSANATTAAPKPLYRDPVHDGAADPEVIRDRRSGKWYMFYTSRRADLNDCEGVEWAHGTEIGIAASDNLADWKFVRNVHVRGCRSRKNTFWAPSIIDDGERYHMFVTLVPGIFSDWDHPRHIIHLTSANLLDWKYVQKLELMSEAVIDPDVQRMPDGTWRMWYNQEPGGKLIAYADSPDLYSWEDHGLVSGIGNCEAPKVFRWKGSWWMIVDEWKGLAVYRSDDACCWSRQEENILQTAGKGQDDGVIGHHCEVEIIEDRAFIFYFTHPDLNSDADPSSANPRRSSIQMAELTSPDGMTILCNRDL